MEGNKYMAFSAGLSHSAQWSKTVAPESSKPALERNTTDRSILKGADLQGMSKDAWRSGGEVVE